MRIDDAALWQEYRRARSNVKRRAAAAAIVEAWLPAWQWHARRTAFPYWPEDVADDYLSEIVATAMRLVERYDDKHEGTGGRVANFFTFVKPYLQPVRWKVEAARRPIPTGIETLRMLADAQQLVNDHEAAGLEPPTLEELARYVSSRHGKKVTESRVRHILEMPRVTSGDAPVDEDRTVWQTVAISDPDPLAELVAREDAAELAGRVRSALAEACRDELDWALADRLMAAPRERIDGELRESGPASYYALSRRFRVTVDAVVAAEDALRERLASLLS